jgi:excisionase family DNA binding protein
MRERRPGARGNVEGREFGEPLLTVGEVATVMRVSNMTVYRLIKSGQLSAIRVGKNYRIRRSDVERYLSDRAVNIATTDPDDLQGV